LKKAEKTKSIIFAGVGGQGIILASDLMAEVLFKAGFDVKKAETHGMAQRGGSVVSFLRFGKKVFSPVFGRGEADIVVAFEELEALRVLPLAAKNSVFLINESKILPMPVVTGLAKYPENPASMIQRSVKELVSVPAARLARESGSARTANLVMLGLLSRFLEIEPEIWQKAITDFFADEDKVKMNWQAFEAGRNWLAPALERPAAPAPERPAAPTTEPAATLPAVEIAAPAPQSPSTEPAAANALLVTAETPVPAQEVPPQETSAPSPGNKPEESVAASPPETADSSLTISTRETRPLEASALPGITLRLPDSLAPDPFSEESDLPE
jgi:indolepyruvate ferredoxin oxidoreductase, beta subunit